ncbi:growth/differentiation factor 15 [Monodelphis domestica]|uniref:Growth/differentiation factor 15 n=1 Tax=Monodelphis domestica TaxID=13616 RepID=A0A5F8HDP5_MONDO|nr:growth/differentiation factor 15 [Monodelphis domestica]
MVSFSMCPIQLRLLPPMLLLLLLPPPPTSGAEPQLMHQERSAELEAIRSAILGRLGLSKPPDVRPPLLSATEVRRLRRRYEEALAQLRTNRSMEETDLHSSSGPSITKVRILAPKVELSRDASNLRFHLLLDREALPVEMLEKPRLMSAQLWLFLQPPSPPPRTEGATFPLEAEAKSLRFDLTRPLRRWLRPGRTAAPQLRMPLALPPSMAPELLRRPPVPRASLRVKFQTPAGRKSRRVRALQPDKDCEEGSGSRCCARSQRVSFQELGWADWVLAPREYEMRFCEGSCPHNYRPASLHAQLKARLHSVSPAAVGPPCCAPSAYEPIVLMHYGSDGQVTLTPFEDLVPTTCHCA